MNLSDIANIKGIYSVCNVLSDDYNCIVVNNGCSNCTFDYDYKFNDIIIEVYRGIRENKNENK